MATVNKWFAREGGGPERLVAITVVDGLTTWTEEAATKLLNAAGFTETKEPTNG